MYLLRCLALLSIYLIVLKMCYYSNVILGSPLTTNSFPFSFIVILLSPCSSSHSANSAVLLCPSIDPYFISDVPLQTPEELDDSDFETEDFDVRSRTSVQTEDDQLIAGQSARVSCHN